MKKLSFGATKGQMMTIRDQHDQIETSAEYAEAAAIPMIHEVHADPSTAAASEAKLPPALMEPSTHKSPARWAYERMILYIQNFEKQLNSDQEVAMGFTGSNAGVIRIEGLGYFDPDILTFYGSTEDGAKTQLVQHVSQLNVMLRAMPTQTQVIEPNRIGFKLARDIGIEEPATS